MRSIYGPEWDNRDLYRRVDELDNSTIVLHKRIDSLYTINKHLVDDTYTRVKTVEEAITDFNNRLAAIEERFTWFDNAAAASAALWAKEEVEEEVVEEPPIGSVILEKNDRPCSEGGERMAWQRHYDCGKWHPADESERCFPWDEVLTVTGGDFEIIYTTENKA